MIAEILSGSGTINTCRIPKMFGAGKTIINKVVQCTTSAQNIQSLFIKFAVYDIIIEQ